MSATLSPAYKPLAALGAAVYLRCKDHALVGIGLVSSSFVGTVSFYGSRDGGNTWEPLPAFTTAAPSGPPNFGTGTVTSATGAGTWFAFTGLYTLVAVQCTAYTSGTALVTLGTSDGSGHEDAFFADTVRYQTGTAAANTAITLTIAADATRAFRLTTVVSSYSVAAPTTANVQIKDGSTVLWNVDLPLALGFSNVPLPANGIVITPGNAINIVQAAQGGTCVGHLNAEVVTA